MAPLDRYMAEFDVSEIHHVELEVAPEAAIECVLALPAGSDRIVRSLFRLRGLRRSELPLDRFLTEVVGLEQLERTPTQFAACGRRRGVRIGLSFDAVAGPSGGSRLVTETRVADAGIAFRLYWIVVGPFSGLIRRRWLRAVERLDRATR